MDDGLEGRKALVVGAYGGMGKAVAAALAGQGVACALMGRSRDKLAETAEACSAAGVSPVLAPCDIRRTETLKAAVDDAIRELGGLNFLINCAGVYALTKTDDGDLDTWDSVLDINLRSTYHLVRHAVPEINKSPGGAVIKIGSIASSYLGAGPFLAATRGIDAYADVLFEEVREFGTKVCTIRPGFVNTAMVSSDRLDRACMIQPGDIARAVLFVLTMPETACPTEITIRPQRSPYR